MSRLHRTGWPLSPRSFFVSLTLCLVASYALAEPRVEIKRVDPSGNVTQLQIKKNATWSTRSGFCYQVEALDPASKTLPSSSKVTQPSEVSVQLEKGGFSLCIRDFLSSFSVKPGSTSQNTVHYFLEINPTDPTLWVSPECEKNKLTVKGNLKAGTWGVAIECELLPTHDIGLKVFTGDENPSKAPPIIFNQKKYAVGQDFIPVPRDNAHYPISVADAKGTSLGSLEITALSTPTPTPVPTPIPVVVAPKPKPTPPAVIAKERPSKIPFEFFAGMTDQSRMVTFSSTSLLNEDPTTIAIQLRGFSRGYLPLNIKFLRDLMYSASVRLDLLDPNGQNADISVAMLAPFTLFSKFNAFIGLGVEYAQSFQSVYGVNQVMAPAVSLQMEPFNGRLGIRVGYASLGASFTKIDSQLIYSPPLRFMKSNFLSVDYGVITVPKLPGGATYDFKETRIGLQIGHRFGDHP
jgi:hypothetical protein